MAKMLLLPIFLLLCHTSYAQLADGSNAPDFDVVDINGNSYNLYAMMGANKSACLDFSATWCGPCWAFHQSGVLESVYNNLSSYTTVVFLEGDWSTNTPCLYDLPSCVGGSQGNWVAGTPYQIADLSASNGPTVKSDYQIGYYPTLYVISPDKRVWEIHDRSYQNYVNWITKSFALNATASLTHSSCGDNGKIILNVTGGHSTLTYKWSNGASSKDLNNIGGGTYSVTITDVNKYFKSYGPFVINGPSKRVDVTNSTLNHILCNNEATGSIQVQVNYGTPPYSYLWSNGYTSNYNVDIKAGNYTLTVTDFNGCTRVKQYTLTQPSDITATAISGKENCNNLDGYIQVKAQGGVPPYFYNLGDGDQPSPFFRDLKGGLSYIVTITDKNGCTENVSSYVDQTIKPIADAGEEKAIDCINEIISLNGSQSDQGSSINFLWTTNTGNILKGAESLFPEINKPGTYYLKVTDTSNKCFDQDSVKVLDAKIYPDIQIPNDTILNCVFTETELKGKSKDLQTKFFWKKVNDTSFYALGKNLLVNQDGKYILNVKDTINLCIAKDTIEIKKDQLLPDVMATPEKNVSCANKEIIIDGSGSSQGAFYKYNWSTTNGHIVAGANTLLPVVDRGGSYKLVIENSLNYCKNELELVVLEHTIPESFFEQSVNDLRVQLTDISKGLPVNWEWNFGDGTKSLLQNPDHLYAAEGEYEICLTTENDCGKSIKCNKILVGINSALTLVSTELSNVSCFNGTDGYIKLKVQGGVTPYQFLWSNMEVTKDLTNISAGNYSVVISDQQGTKLSQGFIIKQPNELLLKNVSITNTVAGNSDGSILIEIEGGLPQYNYLWNNGSTLNPITNLPVGSYSCKITDINNCTRDLGPFEVKELTETFNASSIKYFEVIPNPSNESGLIIVQLDQKKEFLLELLDVYGHSVWSRNSNSKYDRIPLEASHLAKGIYFLRISTENSKKTLLWVLN